MALKNIWVFSVFNFYWMVKAKCLIALKMCEISYEIFEKKKGNMFFFFLLGNNPPYSIVNLNVLFKHTT